MSFSFSFTPIFPMNFLAVRYVVAAECRLKVLLLSSSPIFLKAEATSCDVRTSELWPSPVLLGLKKFSFLLSSREQLLRLKKLNDLLRVSDLLSVLLNSLKPIKPARWIINSLWDSSRAFAHNHKKQTNKQVLRNITSKIEITSFTENIARCTAHGELKNRNLEIITNMNTANNR